MGKAHGWGNAAGAACRACLRAERVLVGEDFQKVSYFALPIITRVCIGYDLRK